jgi:hypothetical protein
MNRRTFLKASGALAALPAAGCVSAAGIHVGSPYASAIPAVDRALVVNDLSSHRRPARFAALIDVGIQHGGSYYLTHHRWHAATRSNGATRRCPGSRH